MANRFKKLDKMWFVAQVFVDVVAVITAVLGVVLGVLVIRTASDAGMTAILEGVLVIVLALVGAAFSWVMLKVALSLYCDVKLIRNKMYGEGNESFAAFMSDPDGTMPKGNAVEAINENSAQYKCNKSLAEQLLEIKQLYDDGVLSQTEFEQAKKKLLGNDGKNT